MMNRKFKRTILLQKCKSLYCHFLNQFNTYLLFHYISYHTIPYHRKYLADLTTHRKRLAASKRPKNKNLNLKYHKNMYINDSQYAKSYIIYKYNSLWIVNSWIVSLEQGFSTCGAPRGGTTPSNSPLIQKHTLLVKSCKCEILLENL